MIPYTLSGKRKQQHVHLFDQIRARKIGTNGLNPRRKVMVLQVVKVPVVAVEMVN